MNIVLNVVLLLAGTGVVLCDTFCQDKWIVYHQSCYLFGFKQNINYSEAEHFCEQQHAHLVKIDDVHESHFLLNFLSQVKQHSWWIGLSDRVSEGQWLWINDHTVPSFTNWSPGEPEERGHTIEEDCVMLHYQFGYKWHDIPCTETFLPICETSSYDGGLEIIGK